MKSKLPNGKIMNGYYGVNGAIEQGWETQEEARNALQTEYENNDELFVVEIEDDNWVIAY